MKKEQVPIWLTDWVIKSPRNVKSTVEGVICKGWNKEELINNKMLKNKVLRMVKAKGKIDNFSVIKIKLISQHSYGPKES